MIPIQLVPSKLTVPGLDPEATGNQQGRASSPAGLDTRAPSADGTSFNLKWVAVATRGL